MFAAYGAAVDARRRFRICRFKSRNKIPNYKINVSSTQKIGRCIKKPAAETFVIPNKKMTKISRIDPISHACRGTSIACMHISYETLSVTKSSSMVFS